jgi:hypothetical protein
MATFNRTFSGIAVEHLFYKVDFMVYCEGNSLNNGSMTYDELFWTKIFEIYGHKVKCKSKGSKSNIKEIAKQIGKNGRVVFAVDRDYDDIFGIELGGLLCTNGYNFESDVSMMFDFDNIIPLFINTTDRDKFVKMYDDFLEGAKRDFYRIAVLDLAYYRNPVELYNRQKPLSVIIVQGTKPPRLNKKLFCRNAIRCKAAGQKDRINLVRGINVYRVVCGKLISRYVFAWMSYLSKKFGDGRSVSYESFISMCINSISKEKAPREFISYYDFNIRNLVA